MVTVGWRAQRLSLGRWIELDLLALVLAAFTFVAADWITWKARGGPLGTVIVTRVQVAPLKGNREEYYPDGTEPLRCSRSVLPWDENGACWWLERRRTVTER